MVGAGDDDAVAANDARVLQTQRDGPSPVKHLPVADVDGGGVAGLQRVGCHEQRQGGLAPVPLGGADEEVGQRWVGGHGLAGALLVAGAAQAQALVEEGEVSLAEEATPVDPGIDDGHRCFGAQQPQPALGEAHIVGDEGCGATDGGVVG